VVATTPERRGGSAGTLTFDLRGLVWGIESEVAVLTTLCTRIDDHVRALNRLRAEAAQRLAALDELVAAAADGDLRAWLDAASAVPLPAVVEHFPDRLYTD
jgi:hypothetical protein